MVLSEAVVNSPLGSRPLAENKAVVEHAAELVFKLLDVLFREENVVVKTKFQREQVNRFVVEVISFNPVIWVIGICCREELRALLGQTREEHHEKVLGEQRKLVAVSTRERHSADFALALGIGRALKEDFPPEEQALFFCGAVSEAVAEKRAHRLEDVSLKRAERFPRHKIRAAFR